MSNSKKNEKELSLYETNVKLVYKSKALDPDFGRHTMSDIGHGNVTEVQYAALEDLVSKIK